MRRITSGLAVALIGLGVLTSGCSGSDEEYCEKLPGYLQTMGESMGGDLEDPKRLAGWADAAEDMADIAPSELQKHWDFIVDYSGRMSAAGADAGKAIKSGDVKKNGEAGSAIMIDARERCGLGR